MGAPYDVIIVGGGHNGLTAAAYLARAGRRVLLLERKGVVGGAAVTEELFPGFRCSTLADGCGYLDDGLVQDLKLTTHGLEILPADPVITSLLPDGRRLSFWVDTERTVREIRQFSERDAEKYPEFLELMSKIAAVIGALHRVTPLDLPDISFKQLMGMMEIIAPFRRLGRKNIAEFLRVLAMPVSDLLNEWFTSEEVKGAIAASGVRGISFGPFESGTVYMLLSRWAGAGNGLFRSAGTVRGGMGMLTQAIAAAARQSGAEIRTRADVVQISIQAEQSTGVVLKGGEQLRAATVISGVDPRTTLLRLVGPKYLATAFVRAVRCIKYRGSAARVHLALRRLPRFVAIPDSESEIYLRGAVQIAPTMDYIQRAFDHAKYGDFSPQPYLDVRVPTVSDASLAPASRHLMSVTAKYAPYQLRHADWETQRDALGDSVLETLTRYAPDFRDSVLHMQVLTPRDMELDYGLPEGNPNHGEMTLDQFFHMRPLPGYARYRTPIAGLWLCGSGSHPGGGVTGLPGKNAAREVLSHTG